jgi:hypothetical protein
MDERRMSRRASLASFGGLVAGAAGLAGLRTTEDAGAGPAGVSSGLISCVLAPEQTEGPYYVDGAALRSDVREGRPGVLLTLRLAVVNASSCKPIKGAAVEIWHCDAGGVYSATSAQDTEDDTATAEGARPSSLRGQARPTWARSRWASSAPSALHGTFTQTRTKTAFV